MVSRKDVRVLVIGSGVIGLTTSYELLNKGYDVTVVASVYPSFSELSPNLASEVAGALCVPPERVGNVKEVSNEEVQRFKKWAAVSGEKFFNLAKNPTVTGVCMKEHIVLHTEKFSDEELTKLRTMSDFYHSPTLIQENELDDGNQGLVDAYSYSAPLVHTSSFLYWLYQECTQMGAHFIQSTIRGSLREQANSLRAMYGVRFIVNCSGLAASELAEDQNVFPLRGVFLIAPNDGQWFPKVNKVFDSNFVTKFGYDEIRQLVLGHPMVIPRGKDKVALGSFYQPNHWKKDISFDAPYVREMFFQSQQTFPRLKNLKVTDCGMIIGVRPARKGGVCLKADHEHPFIVHNYGHSRWGVTFSWGCAVDAVELIDGSHCIGIQSNSKSKL